MKLGINSILSLQNALININL